MKRIKHIDVDDNSLFNESIRKIPDEIKIEIEHNISIAKRLRVLLKQKFEGKQNLLAQKMGKSEAEVSKWFSGTHNFTVRTLAKLESVFDSKIIDVYSSNKINVESGVIVVFNSFGYEMFFNEQNLMHFNKGHDISIEHHSKIYSNNLIFNQIGTLSIQPPGFCQAQIGGVIHEPKPNQILA